MSKASILSALILSIFSYRAQASTEKYVCTSGFYGANQFVVTEEKPNKNNFFECKILAAELGKVLVCNQTIYPWERDVENAVSIEVSYGSNLNFKGRRGRPSSGDVVVQDLVLKCIFSN